MKTNKQPSVEEKRDQVKHFINVEDKFLEKENWVRYITDTVRKDTMTAERQKREENVKEFAEYLKGQLGAYVIEGKPVKDMEYDYPYNDLWGAIDGSVEDFTQPNNPK